MKSGDVGGSRRSKADFRFQDARLCFSFTATLGDRRAAEPLERLVAPGDLGRWCVESGSVASAPACDDADLMRAKQLREAIQRIGEALAHRATVNGDDVAIVNHAAGRPPPAPRMTANGRTASWTADSVDAVLSLVARDLIAISTTELAERVRMCADRTCGSPFLDTSPAGTRQWCSMRTCGALAKKRAYRARRRARKTSA